MRYFIIFILLVGFNTNHAKETQKPNFIIILTDDQGWNALSTRMDPNNPGSGSTYYQTPNLDQLAKEGMRFSRAYSAAPTCSPTRHSLQFGRTPASLQIFFPYHKKNKDIDAKDNESLANVLKSHCPEYVTAHFGKWHIGRTPEKLGFEINDGNNGNLRSSPDTENDPKYTFSLTKKAIGFLEKQKKANKPFLLQVSYYADHRWYEAKTETIRKYTHTIHTNKKTIYHNNPVWAAMNEDLDTGIGILLKRLEELGLKENTYVIFTSDNGYEAKFDSGKPVKERGYYKAHPLRSHKYLLNEGGLRVPFIVRGPGIRGGTFSREAVVTTDIYPTIMAAAGITEKLPKKLEGANLLPYLKNSEKHRIKRKDPFLAFKYSKPNQPHEIVIIEGDYKLLKNEKSGHLYLWNLKEDPGESKNLVNDKPEFVNELHLKMTQYFDQFTN